MISWFLKMTKKVLLNWFNWSETGKIIEPFPNLTPALSNFCNMVERLGSMCIAEYTLCS